ncbi:MAG: hypothetical protein G8345_10845 [Magnetococcales bacterium]|nr:hypothetical protein [Magnetococcales bacterium]NGZ27369.1 hypothetical protein [Magnetococcales bacterium]
MAAGLNNKPEPQQQDIWQLRLGWIILLAVGVVYGQTWNFDFINYDDAALIIQDPMIAKGVTWEGLEYAFSSSFPFLMPLNRLVNMVQFELFGSGYAWGYHLTNVWFHLLNSLILFHLLTRMTARLLPAASVALLFAVHPMHVEAVAWVSELREVMSFFFGFLAMVNYHTFVTWRDAPWSAENHRRAQHAFRWLLFNTICSLLAKPMWVTFPFLLLLLDWWPLQRTHRSIWFLVKEKISLFLLIIFFASLTVASYQSLEILASLADLTLETRFANMFVSWALYLGKTFVPLELGLIYPYYDLAELAWWQLTGAILLPFCLTGLAWWVREEQPWWMMGWLWFIGTLLPVSGLINGGNLVAMTDRWSYLPHVGLFIALAWGVAHWAGKSKGRLWGAGVVVAVFCLYLTVLAWMQTSYWQNSITIWQRTADVTGEKRKGFALHMLALSYLGTKEDGTALQLMEKVVELAPQDAGYLNYRAILLVRLKRHEDAFDTWERMAELPRVTHVAMAEAAKIMLMQGAYPRAVSMYQRALDRTPPKEKRSTALINFYLARSLLGMGETSQAEEHFQRFFQLDDVEMDKKCGLVRESALETKGYPEFMADWKPLQSYCKKK